MTYFSKAYSSSRALRLSLPLLLASGTAAFAQNTTGQISGQIVDTTNAALPAATVTAVNTGTGRVNTATTDSSGLYVLPSLAIGTYTVTIDHAGFSKTVTTVVLNVDENLRLNLALKVGTDTQAVNVEADSGSLETTNASITGTFENAQISELPINGRDYGRFTLLTPGAVLRTSQIADITFNGMQSTNNQFTIDGIDATRIDGAYLANGSERGARLLTGSLDTIAEFKSNSSNYTADYGRATGGVVNIVTKSGANAIHGGVYDYLRNDFFDAKNYFQPVGVAAPKRFNDFGAFLSGAVIKDKMFYFASYEATRQSIGLVGGGLVLSAAKIASLNASQPALAPILQAMPTAGAKSAYLTSIVISPNAADTTGNTVTASVTGSNHVRENVGSLRLDNNWGTKDSTFLRYNANYSIVNGPLFGVTASAFGLNDHQAVSAVTTNIALSETHIFSPTLLNNFLAGIQQYITAFDQSGTLPTISIGGLTISPGGRGVYGREPKDIQYGDTVTWIKGHHTLKFGANVWNVYEPFHGFLSAPTVAFSSIATLTSNQVTSASISATFPNNNTKMIQVGSFITDTWQVRPNVAISAGLRWDWNQIPHDFTPASVWSTTTNSLTTPGSSYYQPYYKNFAPRVGIAYSPNQKIVVRAGYGMYVEAFQIGTFYNEITNTTPGTTTLSSANIPGLSFPVTQYLSSATTALPSLSGFEAKPRNPLNNQWTLSVGAQLGPKTTATLAYVGNHALRLYVPEGVNYINPVTGVRPFPSYSNITISTFEAQSNYNAAQLEVKQAVKAGLTATVDFSYSHALANEADGGLYSQGPQQPFNLSGDYGNASNDVRNNVSFNLLYALPFGKGKQFLNNSNGIVNRAVGGWSLATLGIAHSGIASTVYLSSGNRGDGDNTNQRPNRVPGVSLYTASHAKTSSNTVPFLNLAAFTVPTPAPVAPVKGAGGVPGAYGNSPAGVFYGPKFAQFDLSLIKDTAITERTKFQFRAEFFNILNHPNLGAPSGTFSTGSSSFGLITSTVGTSIGFGTARQLQLAAKILF